MGLIRLNIRIQVEYQASFEQIATPKSETDSFIFFSEFISFILRFRRDFFNRLEFFATSVPIVYGIDVTVDQQLNSQLYDLIAI